MCVLTRGERFKDARIVHNQHGSQSMDEVYSATGISQSMIKDLEDDEKNRSVGYDKIAILARHYGVSSDFLLGLSPYPTVEKDLEYICKYTGLSEASVKYLKLLTDVQAGKVIHPGALKEISQYEKDEKEYDDEYYDGYYDYKCNQYSEDIDERHGAARRYGIEDKNNISAIAKAEVASSKEYHQEHFKQLKEDTIEESQIRASLSIRGLNAILSSDQQKDILSDLSFFLQLDTSQTYNGKSSFLMSIDSKDGDMGINAQLPLESIAWGFLRKAEKSLADLRCEFNSKLLVDQVD